MSVRVRFAPSPTGYLHIGGLRTALYNYLFAKHHEGKLILRIEDTDRTRFVENATENLVESLSWAGIEFDESPFKTGEYGPYVQSDRLEIYKQYAKILIDNGSAYYSFDSAEELELMRQHLSAQKKDPKYDRYNMKNQFTLTTEETERMLNSGPFVIRLKIPEGEVRFKDIIRGDVVVPAKDIDDQVLIKSDGFPTYHLANVVDDYLMKITHVIRGEEWLPSTPKHILLYNAFGWKVPEFAHLPLLLNKDKSKLSKRQGDVAVEDYRKKGYIKDAIVNFVALLGWNPTADKEIYSIEELIDAFNLEKVNKGGAVFDIQKLDWMNAQYLRNSDVKMLAENLLPYLGNEGYKDVSKEYAIKVIELFKERINILPEILNFKFMFEDPQDYDMDYYKKHWKDDTNEILLPLIKIFMYENDFSHTNLHNVTLNHLENVGLKLKQVIHPLRLMITGKSSGAGMFETMEVLGKETCIRRIDVFLKKFN